MKKFSNTIIILIILFYLLPFPVAAKEQNSNETEMEPIVVTGIHEAESHTPASPVSTKYGI